MASGRASGEAGRGQRARQAAHTLLVDAETTGDGFYATLKTMRDDAPLFYYEEADLWIASGHSEVRSISTSRSAEIGFADRNDRTSPGWRNHHSRTNMADWFGHQDGAQHLNVRKALNEFFLPAATKSIQPALEAMVNEVLGDFRAAGGGNVLQKVGMKLTEKITDDLLGLTPQNRPEFGDMIEKIMKTFDFGLTEQEWRDADAAATTMRAFWHERIYERFADPQGDDIIAQLIRTRAFDREQIVVIAENILAAATDTTSNTSTNGLLLLLQHPEVLAQARSDAAARAGFADEVLRLVSAAPTSGRAAVADIAVGDLIIPAGSTILLSLAAANRDPAVFEKPDALRLDRTTSSRVLAFGQGVHVCLGQWFVRSALSMLYGRMLDLFEAIEIVGEPPEASGIGIRSCGNLIVRVS